MKVSVGPGLEDLKRLAEARIDLVFKTVRERRALYLPKALEARRHLANVDGEASTEIIKEAEAVGKDPYDLAHEIVTQAERDAVAELTRVRLKHEARGATTEEQLKAILKPHGIGIYE